MTRKQIVRLLWTYYQGQAKAEKEIQDMVNEYAIEGFSLQQIEAFADREGDVGVWLVFKEEP